DVHLAAHYRGIVAHGGAAASSRVGPREPGGGERGALGERVGAVYPVPSAFGQQGTRHQVVANRASAGGRIAVDDVEHPSAGAPIRIGIEGAADRHRRAVDRRGGGRGGDLAARPAG